MKPEKRLDVLCEMLSNIKITADNMSNWSDVKIAFEEIYFILKDIIKEKK